MAQFILTGFADEACPQIEGQIKALKRNDMDYIEMRGVNGKNVIDLTDEEAIAIKAMLDKNGIRLSAVGSPIGKIKITDDFAPHLEKLKRTVELAKIFETDKIRLFSFYIPEGEKPETYRDEVLKRMQAMLDVADGITLCHENEHGIYGEAPDKVLDLHQQLPDLKAIFDPANYVCADADIMWGINNINPYIDYLHIKDAIAGDKAMVPAGKGDGFVAEVLEKVGEKDGTIFLSVEPHLAVFTGYSSIDKRELKNKYTYETNDDAFDVAVNALKEVLTQLGYKKGENNIWKK